MRETNINLIKLQITIKKQKQQQKQMIVFK